MTPLGPIGFWSYTTQDDTSSRGRLSQLRRLLSDEIQQSIGRTPRVTIFQDVAAIPPGSDWERQIRLALDQASFLIPIITPGFLQSEWCCKEILYFRERERQVGRDDLIFPVYYNDVADFETIRRAEVHDPDVLRLLRERQWVDFRDLRHSSLESEAVAKRIERVATGIRSALYRGTPPTTPPPSVRDGPAARPPEPPSPPSPAQPETRQGGRGFGGSRLTRGAAIVVLLLGFGFVVSYAPPIKTRRDGAATPSAVQAVPDPGARTFLIFFDWNRADLTQYAQNVVLDAARYGKSTPFARIDVDGHNDTSQPADDSMAISERRARLVAAELVRNGIPQGVISIHVYGDTRLLVPTGPGVREPQNRRVDIVFR